MQPSLHPCMNAYPMDLHPWRWSLSWQEPGDHRLTQDFTDFVQLAGSSFFFFLIIFLIPLAVFGFTLSVMHAKALISPGNCGVF